MVFLVIFGLLAVIGFIYIAFVDRSNWIVNLIMTVIGIIAPAIYFSIYLSVNYDFTILSLGLPWWVYIIATLVDALLIFLILFARSEKMRTEYDWDPEHGWTKKTVGGSLGLAVLTLAVTTCLISALVGLFV